jgi:hypothetical protein
MYRRAGADDQVIPSAYGWAVLAAALTRRLGPERAVPASLAVGAVWGCALIALVDPNDGGRYPACPTRALLGIDCPACGTLRGLHALSRGQLARALDHNILLVLAVPIGAAVWLQWVRSAVGRPARPVSWPRWGIPCLVVVAFAFTVLRNVSGGPLGWLGSTA